MAEEIREPLVRRDTRRTRVIPASNHLPVGTDQSVLLVFPATMVHPVFLDWMANRVTKAVVATTAASVRQRGMVKRENRV